MEEGKKEESCITAAAAPAQWGRSNNHRRDHSWGVGVACPYGQTKYMKAPSRK